jgi:hypothetical protein
MLQVSSRCLLVVFSSLAFLLPACAGGSAGQGKQGIPQIAGKYCDFDIDQDEIREIESLYPFDGLDQPGTKKQNRPSIVLVVF